MKGCRALTDPEICVVLAAIESKRFGLRDRALFLLGLRSGFRISELLSLKIADVVQNGNFTDRIEVARRNMKKKLAGRQVALHSEAKKALQEWVKEAHKIQIPRSRHLYFPKPTRRKPPHES